MSQAIHPSAVIHDGAELGEGVEIGPFCEVGPHVRLGANVKLHGRVSIIGRTVLDEGCEVFPGAVIGGRAQSIGSKDHPDTGVHIGPRTVLREIVTIHAGLPGHRGVTRVGADCYFMHTSHIGHDGLVGDKCVIANGVQIGGHCTIGNNVWFGGVVAVHQFTHIGDHAFVSGGAILVGDLVPFSVAIGNRARLSGLNVKGLKRRGFDRADLRLLREAYQLLFEQADLPFADRLALARERYVDAPLARQMVDFVDNPARSRPLCLPDAA